METLNERIKNLRKEKNLTQLQLAEILNVTDKAVSKWEVGEANPDIGLLPKLAETFGVTLDYLLTGKKEEEKISLEDMDSEKRMHYLIKKDDPENFNKYSYDDQNKNGRLNGSQTSIYYGRTIKFGNTELPILNISVWKEIINEKANRIFNICCDSLLSQVKDNISIAVLLTEILDEFIKKCIELDRDDVLKALGVRYFEIGVNKNDKIGQRKTFYLPIVFERKYEKESTFFISKDTLEYFFVNEKNSPNAFKYITDVEIKTKISKLSNVRPANTIEYYYTCTSLYNEIILLAIKFETHEVIYNHLNEFKKELQYFNEIKERYNSNFYNFNKTYILNDYSTIQARLVDITEEVITSAINKGKLDIAKELISYNKSIIDSLKSLSYYRGRNTDFIYLISESEIDRLSKLNNADLKEDEKLKLEAVNNYIINPTVLRNSRNLKLVREIIDNNYYNYYEFAYESMKNKNVKELFKFFVDNEFGSLAVDLMNGEEYYSSILSSVWRTFSSAPGYSGYKENKKLIDAQNKTGLELKPLNNSSCGYNSYENSERNVTQYAEIFKRKYGEVNQYINKFEENPIIECIKELKEEIYNDVANSVATEKKAKEEQIAREKVAKGLTKDYFKDLLSKNEKELFIIKLCALQDAIFMYDYHYDGEDYSARLESHFKDLNEKAPKSRTCDDGWGYDVEDSEWERNEVIPAQEYISHLRDLFYRLRITRNNISHAAKEKVVELNEEELNECLEYVFSISKVEE